MGLKANTGYKLTLDIETTGLDKEENEIISFAGAVFDPQTSEVLTSIHLKFQFDPNRANPIALRKNRIDPDAHNSHPDTLTRGAGKTELIAFLEQTRERYGNPRSIVLPSGKVLHVKDLYVQGYNVQDFDLPFISYFIQSQEESLPERKKTKIKYLWDSYRVYDVFQDVQKLQDLGAFANTGIESKQLEALAAYLGLDTSRAHDALEDVALTHRVGKIIDDYFKLLPPFEGHLAKLHARTS